MPFPDAITRFFVSPEERDEQPATDLAAAFFEADPVLPSIATERGTIAVRRVVGLHEGERALADLWTPAGFSGLLREHLPSLCTDLQRPSLEADAAFVEAIEAGSRREGSQVSFVAVPGVQWGQDEDGAIFVSFPGGADAQRILRMVRARLPFDRHLLVHDIDPSKPDAVAFEPAKAIGFRNEGSTLVMKIPADHELFETLEQVDGPGVNWKFG
jgi:hypothetical protein